MMFHKTVVLAAVLGLSHNAVAQSEKVVFVHGLGGFDELLGGAVQYWEELDEFQKEGFETFAAKVGPVSSNHDRACELYAQIKGTRTDYGAAHSARFGHQRYGPDFTGKGFFPEWSPSNPIHLVGHSMGGQTIRYLEYLLQDGDADERRAGGTVSPLFQGLGNMVRTITSVSTPHNGSPIADILQDSNLIELVKNLIVFIASLVSNTPIDFIYDFGLDHFGISGQRNGESFEEYADRIARASIFQLGFRDYAGYDLTEEGSLAMQQKMPQTYSGTDYFAFATDRTLDAWHCDIFPPRCGWIRFAGLDMSIFLIPFANLMGSLNYDSTLRKNDGLVSVDSGSGPKLAYGGRGVRNYDGTWRSGVWNALEVRRDHLQIVGLDWNRGQVQSIYRTHARRIKALVNGRPQLSSARDQNRNENETTEEIKITRGGMIGLVAMAGVGSILSVFAVVALVRYRRNKADQAVTSEQKIVQLEGQYPVHESDQL